MWELAVGLFDASWDLIVLEVVEGVEESSEEGEEVHVPSIGSALVSLMCPYS